MNSAQAFTELSRRLAYLYGDEGEGRSVARIVLEDALNLFPPYLDHRLLNTLQQEELERITLRLLQGEPVQYVLGEADFYGLKFQVGPGVLIPRPETEELVYAAVQWLQNQKNEPGKARVLDIGTGSGCIAVTLKTKCPWISCTAIDLSEEALDFARKNAERHHAEIQFIQLDFLNKRNWESLPEFDLILSNPPYIPESERRELELRVREYEPDLALFVPDAEPLRFYSALSAFAAKKLAPHGALAAECHAGYAQEAEQLWRASGWTNVHLEQDLSGRPRMLWARKTPD